MSRLRRVREADGQASLEVVALAPVVVAVALGVLQLLAAGAAAEFADHAAEAAGIALIQRSAPARAARDAVPGWARSGMRVSVRGARVRVTVRPPSPSRTIGRLLTSSAEADAGRGSR